MTQVRSSLSRLLLFSSWFLVIQGQLVIDQNDGLSVLDQLGLPNLPNKVRVVSHARKRPVTLPTRRTSTPLPAQTSRLTLSRTLPQPPQVSSAPYGTASMVWHCEYSFGTLALYQAFPVPLGMQLAANYIPFPLVNTPHAKRSPTQRHSTLRVSIRSARSNFQNWFDWVLVRSLGRLAGLALSLSHGLLKLVHCCFPTSVKRTCPTY